MKEYIVRIPVSTYLEFKASANGPADAIDTVRDGDGEYLGCLSSEQLRDIDFSWGEREECEAREVGK